MLAEFPLCSRGGAAGQSRAEGDRLGEGADEGSPLGPGGVLQGRVVHCEGERGVVKDNWASARALENAVLERVDEQGTRRS